MTVDAEALPSFIALAVVAWSSEAHEVQRLWRICDAFDVIVRYLVAIVAADRIDQPGGSLAPELSRRVFPLLQRPTFGSWVSALRVLLRAQAPSRRHPSVLGSDARDAFERYIAPLLGSGTDDPADHLLPLRNLLAHGGGLTRRAAGLLLEGHERRALHAMRSMQGWLASHVVVHARDTGVYGQLRGPRVEPSPIGPLPVDVCSRLDASVGNVLLLGPSGELLDLSPICAFGVPAMSRSGKRDRRGDYPVPELYVRSEDRRVLYSAHGSELAWSERGEDTLRRFLRMFAPSEPGARGRGASSYRYEDEALEAAAAACIGRVEEIETIARAVTEADEGVLWVRGVAGIGKSTILTAVARHPKLRANRHLRVVVQRFKVGDVDCSRAAFLRRAVTSLERWPPLGRAEGVPVEDVEDAVATVGELERRLTALLDRAGELRASDPRGRPPRVIFVLDGVDEVARNDRSFPDLPFALTRPNVIWLCAGRPEPALVERFERGRAQVLFSAGVPPMIEADIRAMLLESTGALRYEILGLDREQDGGLDNRFVRALIEHAAGLPLYVRLAVEDLVSGQLRVSSGHEDLPDSLEAYYEELIRRYGIDDLHSVLTPLVAMLAVALEPITAPALHAVLVWRGLVSDGAPGAELVQEALAIAAPMLRLAPSPEGGDGYLPYHETFRGHVLATPRLAESVAAARDALARAASRWSDRSLEPARAYLGEHGAAHLLETGRAHEAAALLCDYRWIEERLRARGLSAITSIEDDFKTVEEVCHTHEILEWSAFWTANEHIFRRGDAEWPAERILLQRAYEHGGVPGTGAEVRAAAITGAWIRRVNRRTVQDVSMRIRTIETGMDAISLDCYWGISRDDSDLGLWDLETGNRVRVLRGHASRVLQVEISHDGRHAVSCSCEAYAVWDLDTGSFEHVPASARPGLRLSPDGRRVLLDTPNGTGVWNLERRCHEHIFENQRGFEYATWLDAERVGLKNRITLLSTPSSMTRVSWFTGHCRAFNGVRVVSIREVHHRGMNDPEYQLICTELETGREQTIAFAMSRFKTVAISGDGRRVAFDHHDGGVVVYEIDTRCSSPHRRLGERSASVALTAEGRWGVACELTQTGHVARVWDVDSGECEHAVELDVGNVGLFNAELFASNGRRLLAQMRDDSFGVWDLATGSRERVIEVGSTIYDMALSPDGTHAASTSPDGKIRVWNLEIGSLEDVYDGTPEKLAFTADSLRWITAASTWHVVDLPTGTRHADLEDPWDHCDVDKRWPLIRDAQTRSSLASIAEELHRTELDPSPIALTDDGTRMVSARHSTLQVWDVGRSSLEALLHGHVEPITRLVISSNGQRAVSASHDATIVWDIRLLEGPRLVSEARIDSEGAERRMSAAGSGRDRPRWRRRPRGRRAGWHRPRPPYHRPAGEPVWHEREWSEALGHHVDAAALSPDGGRAVIADRTAEDGWRVLVWNVETNECERVLERTWADPGQQDITVTGDGTRAVHAHRGGLALWSLETGARERTLPITDRDWASYGWLGDRELQASFHGLRGVARAPSGSYWLWDFEKGSSQRIDADACALAPDGRWVVMGSSNRTVRVWDHEAGVLVARWDGEHPIIQCTLARDGTIRATDTSGDVISLQIAGPRGNHQWKP